MIKLQFTQIGPTSSDCTARYKVEPSEKCTVQELIDSIISTRGEWGTIGIKGDEPWFSPCEISVKYKCGEILESNLSNEDLSKVVKSVEGHGGWTYMSYKIITE